MKRLFRIIILLTFFFIFNVKASSVCTYKFKLSDITCSFTYDYVEGDAPEFKCYNANGGALNYEYGTFYRFNYNGSDYTITYDASGFLFDLGAEMFNSGKCLPITYKFGNANMTNPNDKEVAIGSDYSQSVLAGSTVTLIGTSSSSSSSIPSSTPSSTPSRNPYDEIESCDENSNDYIVACACMPAAVADITSFIYGFLKIGGPVLLIILGAVDLGKAIVATDESGIQKAKKKLVNKFVAAASIFLVFSIVQMIVSIVGGGDYVQQVEGNCLYYLLNGFKP